MSGRLGLKSIEVPQSSLEACVAELEKAWRTEGRDPAAEPIAFGIECARHATTDVLDGVELAGWQRRYGDETFVDDGSPAWTACSELEAAQAARNRRVVIRGLYCFTGGMAYDGSKPPTLEKALADAGLR